MVHSLGFIIKQGQLSPDPAKVEAVAEWPTPSSHKQLQCFLGFANFYLPFIREYSKVAVPLTRLTSTLQSFAQSVRWRQLWLEGSFQPFVLWTDHKNLAYLWSVKHLNLRQAHWALFLGRFNFTLTYCPGSKNAKPDGLSHQFARVHAEPEITSILSLSCVMGAATW